MSLGKKNNCRCVYFLTCCQMAKSELMDTKMCLLVSTTYFHMHMVIEIINMCLKCTCVTVSTPVHSLTHTHYYYYIYYKH